MKRFTLILSMLAILVFSGCQEKIKINPSNPIQDSRALLSGLPNPPADYRAAPLWDWNDKITKEEIEFQMTKFKEGGIGGVFVHPRPGLVTEYLSEEWHQLYDFTVEMAKKLDMRVWIYDENSYPSGFAGGHVQDRYPDSYKHGTGLGCKITENLADTAGLEVVTILTKPSANSTYYIFHVTHPSKSWWYGGFPYVDLLYAGVTDTFKSITMQGYEKYNKEDFGTTLKGIFTDEPNLEAAKGPGTLLRWTPDLFEQFQKRWGYDLKTNLISLIEESGDWMKVRHDYFTLMLELFLDRWAVPWFDYCEKNNLDWTGHYWEHGWPYPGDGIDEAAFYMYHQMPGVDMLGRSYDAAGMEGQFGNTRACRELGSAANQSGWNRRLSETWGGAGWQISFAEMKRLVDWEVVLGVNFVNPHLSYFSMQGVRKFDYPPSFSYQEPWWGSFSLMGDYVGRICMAMSAGEQINKTLVIQPNTTAWMYHSATKNHKAIYELSKTFKSFIQNLEAQQLEYDLGSEQVLKRFGTSDSKGISLRERSYNRFIIPPGMRNIETNTLNLLEEFMKNGYSILCLSDSVNFTDGKPDQRVSGLAAKYPENWIRGNIDNTVQIQSFLATEGFSLKQTDPKSGQIFHQRRYLKDGQILFLVNSDLEKSAEAQLEIQGKYLTELNLLTGKPQPMEHSRNSGNLTAIVSIPEGGSKLLLITNKPVNTEKALNPKNQASIAAKGDITVKRLENNVLTIDYLDLETRNQRLKGAYFMTAMYALFKESGLPTGNPWQHKIQFRQQYLDMNNFGDNTGFTVRYQFKVDAAIAPEFLSDLEAVIERPDQWKVLVNGTEISPEPGKWWLDRHFPVYRIGSSVRTGVNTIELQAPKMTVFSEIMPVYILGNFDLINSTPGFTITNPSAGSRMDWKDAGMPFYGETVCYTKDYAIDELSGKYLVKVNNWKGAVIEVWVNGEKAGLIGWKPYELEITENLRKGANSVEIRITGSLKNTLGYHHVIQTGWIDSPWSWNQAPEKQPAGSEYQFLKTGLSGDFEVVNLN